MGVPSRCSTVQVLAYPRQIDKPVYRPQKMIRWHMLFEIEAIEERLLHHRALAHHPPISDIVREMNQSTRN